MTNEATPAARGLKSISSFITKGATPTTYGYQWQASGVPFLRSECVSQHGLDMSQAMFISPEADRALQRSRVRDGDILMTITGYVGRVIRLAGLGPANINQHIARIRITDPSFDSGYVYHYLSQPRIKRHYEAITTGQAYPQISLAQVRDTLIPEVSLGMQREISSALDSADAHVDLLAHAVAKKCAIKQGLMQQLLTGRKRLTGSVGEWRPKRLAELLSYEQPGPFLVESVAYVEAGTPVLTAGKTFILGYTTEQTGIYQAFPVIIFDDFTTASKYVDFPFKAKSSAMKILSARPGVDLRFVYERMQLIDFIAVDHKRRWITEYSKLDIAVPPLEEQEAIAAVIRDVDAEIESLERRLEAARAMKQGMMQELLTGRTRLVPAEVFA